MAYTEQSNNPHRSGDVDYAGRFFKVVSTKFLDIYCTDCAETMGTQVSKG